MLFKNFMKKPIICALACFGILLGFQGAKAMATTESIQSLTSQEQYLLVRACWELKRKQERYPRYNVGTALLTSTDKIYESADVVVPDNLQFVCVYGFFKAVKDGHRDFNTLAIVDASDYPDLRNMTAKSLMRYLECIHISPSFSDLKNFNLKVIIAKITDDFNFKVYTLEELLPESFRPDNL